MTKQTFEASPIWRNVLRRNFPLREKVVDLGDAEVILWKHPLYSRWISTPFRDRLAIRWRGTEFRFDEAARRRLFSHAGDIILKDCAAFMPQDSLEEGSAVIVRQQHTNAEVVLDAEVERRMNRSARKNWRRATEEYGLEIELNPPVCFEEFYKLYLETRHRLGAPPYGRNMFRELFHHLGQEVVVFRCHDGNRCYGYLMCYVHEAEMISAHIGYLFEHREKRIADFLFISAFRWGVEQGLRTYRFGGDFNNQSSLIAAKKKLGAIPRRQVDLVSVARKLSVDNPNGLLRNSLRALPKPVFRQTSLLTQLYFE